MIAKICYLNKQISGMKLELKLMAPLKNLLMLNIVHAKSQNNIILSHFQQNPQLLKNY